MASLANVLNSRRDRFMVLVFFFSFLRCRRRPTRPEKKQSGLNMQNMPAPSGTVVFCCEWSCRVRRHAACGACTLLCGIAQEQTKARVWVARKHTMSRSNSSRLSLTSLHDAARKGDSRSLQQLIAAIDPTAAEKVAAILLQGSSGKSLCSSSAGTDPSLGKQVHTWTYIWTWSMDMDMYIQASPSMQ